MIQHGAPPPLPDFRLLFEAAPGRYLVLAPDFTIVAVSDAYLAATMTRREEIVGRALFDVFPDNPADPGATGESNLRASLEQVLAERRPHAMAVQKYDIRRPAAAGGAFEERYWSPVNTPVLGPDGAVAWIIHRVEDVTDFLRLEREARYRMLFQANPHPMWVYDRATLRFLAVNDAAIRMYGWSADEFLAMTIADICPPEDVPRLRAEVERREDDAAAPREWRHRRRDGTVLAVEIASHRVRFDGRDAALVLATDVTRRKQLEDQLRQAQKMEAIGLLAGGVAHDFNNLLTAIMGYGEMLRLRLDGDAAAEADVDEILLASQRAATLTRQLLAFSRQQVLQPRVVDLNTIVSDMDRMIRRLIGEDIDLLTAAAPDLGHVRVDPGQIEQVLMNLVVNARDAMPEGGKLTIETGNVELDEGATRGRVELPAGRYVMIAVSDTGCGMSEATTSRIFEPFFTTKETGRGTGLGLSTVHGIVQQSGGHIEVYTEPGSGTTFKVYLPRVDQPAEAAPVAPAAPESLGGDETVLLVEDEELIRRVVAQTLERLGYRVIAVRDGTHALAVCARRDQGIDLLVTDVVMPNLSGPQLARRALALRPGLAVLYVSGYTDRALVHQGQREAGTAFLQKPFTPDALARKVRDVLDRRPGAFA